MKHRFFRFGAAVLTAVLLVSTANAAQVLQQSKLSLADSVALTSAFVDNGEASKEHVLTYRPGGDVRPMVVYGDSLYGRSTMDYIEAYVAGKGYTAVAAVNAAFFDMSNGIPIGMVVTDGVLRSSGGGVTVGIEADGTVKIGQPELKVEGSWGKETILLHYNQLLVKNNGIVLYSRDYDTRTKGALAGYHVVLQAEEAFLPLNGQMKAKVSGIVEDTKSCAIPQGGFVLSIAEEGDYEPFQQALRSLKVGDTVTLRTSIDRDWEQVDYAVGGGDLLVEGGKACSSFQLDSAERQAPRTALGLKRNGDVVVYTVDRSRNSAGMTLAELAQRMVELGCVTAVNLDGGGSTCVGVTQPGDRSFTTVNDPSDGQQRACANFLFFVRPTTASGAAKRLFVYPYDRAVLPGGQVELTVKAADGNYMPASLPGTVSWSASGGTVERGVFTAGQPGTATVTASAGGLSGSAVVQVVETPTAMTVLWEDWDKPVESLLVETGTDVSLTAQAQYLGMELAARDSSFRWSVSGGLGKVTQDGTLTAGPKEGRGVLTVSCGSLETEIPLELRENPMTDLENHWARFYISQLYFQGVLKGAETDAGDVVYRPDDSMTRQEFLVALIRWLGVDTAAYTDVELPFADETQIADWAMDAVKAAYALDYFTGSAKNGKVYAEPSTSITREAAMTILARTANASSDSDALEEFPDESKVSDWARPALTAMVEQGVINGIGGKLQPQGMVTRAQVAKMLFMMD